MRGVGPARPDGGVLLDIGTGTGDLLFDFARGMDPGPGKWTLVGLDLSFEMIRRAGSKLGDRAWFVQGSAERLPFTDGSADVVVSSFALRNVRKIISPVLSEIWRVLKPGGKALLLEMYAPDRPVVNWLHRLYLKTVLPAVGRAVLKGGWPDDYLSQTILNFWSPEHFRSLLEGSGFSEVGIRPLTGGIAVLHSAWKRPASAIIK
ncbi:MAG: hypothetical protein A2902_07640 [Elusimicrobia bacterium RIFCSPLOWO2_01_FULL_64_13]|nr:MAG: hypothetical protein A2902_07640 [Elusimicrobia bacterium RIFCSPLOWO2_01_FULL_64_13]